MKSFRWPLVLIIGGWILTTALNILLLPDRFAHHVAVETIQKNPLPLIVRAPGDLEPKRSVTFKAEFDGPILKKNFEEGKPVRAGQLLVEIGRDKILGDYQSKSDAVKNAKSDLFKARKDLKLQKALYRREAVALSTVEDADRALVRAEQALESAQQAFRVESELWNKNKFVAPFDGVLFKDYVENEPSATAGKEVLTVADLSGYIVKARIDELEIGQIKEGQDAEVRLPTFEHALLTAKVSQIGVQPEGTGVPEIPVSLVLVSSGGVSIRPKLTAEVRIQSGQTEPVLSVPLTTIDNHDGEPKVWLLDASSRLRSRKVTLGRSNPDRAEITNGLSEGDQVAVTVEPYYAEGMKVRIGPPLAPGELLTPAPESEGKRGHRRKRHSLDKASADGNPTP